MILVAILWPSIENIIATGLHVPMLSSTCLTWLHSNSKQQVSICFWLNGLLRAFRNLNEFCFSIGNRSTDKPLQDHSRTSPGPLQDLSRTSPGPLQDLSRTSPEPLQDLSRIFTRPLQASQSVSAEAKEFLNSTEPEASPEAFIFGQHWPML